MQAHLEKREKMLKVIQVISDTNIGGAGIYLLSFLDFCDRTMFETSVYIPTGSKLKKELEKREVPYTEIPHMEDSSFSVKAVQALYKKFKMDKPDIVHTHASLSARIAAKMAGRIKIVQTRHSVFDLSEKDKKFYKKAINRFINSVFSDMIIAVSPAAMRNLTDLGTSPKKIRVIYNGVTPPPILKEADRSQVLQRFKLNNSDFGVAIIARLTPVKGHVYVLECAKILSDAGEKDIKIIIAGTGQQEVFLKEEIKRKKLNNVYLAGFVKDIWQLHNIMKLQINTSYGTEATSLALLEGMSLGKPAVVSDFGGNPFVIEDGVNGMVVPKKEPKALAEAIIRIKNDEKLYERLSQGSVAIYQEKFKVQDMVRNIENLYKELI